MSARAGRIGLTGGGAALVLLLAAVPAGAAVAASPPAALTIAPAAAYDFNGDGFAELVVSAVHEALTNTEGGAGVVHVLPGTAEGVTATGSQVWGQDSPGVLEEAEDTTFPGDSVLFGDEFGAALGSGDFDGDGFADLAVGAPSESVDGVSGGAVNVLYGSAQGLTAERNQLFSQTGGALGANEGGDRFGDALAAGDLDGDGLAELAVGVPGEGVGSAQGAGALVVLRGSPTGLTAEGAQSFHQATAGVPSAPGQADSFGAALTTGRLVGDSRLDLVVGVPGETVNGRRAAGVVHVLTGSATGLTTTGSALWHQDRSGVRGAAETSDNFGLALAVGDFDADERDDLATAVAYENRNAGAVSVLYGATGGLSAARNQLFSQNTAGVPGHEESGDVMTALAAGDFGGHAGDDLAIGQPGESAAVGYSHGAVLVLPSSAAGLTATGSRLWSQDSAGVGGTAEPHDSFGWAVSARQYGRGAQADLVVGVPFEDGGTVSSSGLAHVLYGASGGLTATGSQVWGQDSPGVGETAEPNDFFGAVTG